MSNKARTRTPKEEPVEIGADGMPADPILRRIAVVLKFKATTNGVSFLDRDDVISRCFKKPEQQAQGKRVMKALIAAGTIRDDHGHYAFHQPAKLVPDTPEARLTNYDNVARTVAARACSTDAGQAKAKELFKSLREIYGTHRQTTPEGEVLIIPTNIVVNDRGPDCAAALVVHISRRGIRLLDARPEAFSAERYPNQLIGRLDLGLCAPNMDEQLQTDLDMSYVSAYTSQMGVFPGHAAKLLKASFQSLHRCQEAAEGFLGEKLEPRRWRSFIGSVKRAKNLQISIRRVIFAALDKDVRKACLRNPMATHTLYDWFCAPNDELRMRRLQASAAFPILSLRLPEFQGTIDQGMPLIPALAETLDMPQPMVRRLRGITWQRLGRHFFILGDKSENSIVAPLIGQIRPENLPTSKDEWEALRTAAHLIDRTVSWPAPGSIAIAASRNWMRFATLASNGLEDAIRDAGRYIGLACDGTWEISDGRYPAMQKHDTAAARAVVHLLSGTDGGLKRLAEFSHRWHVTQGWRTAAIRKIRRDLIGEFCIEWAPLTKQPFTPSSGTFRWLCNEDELAVEGLAMRHCVGSYADYCAYGISHIAAICDANGNRSTAEFRIEDKKVVLQQHKARNNLDPSAGCEAIAIEFLKFIRKERRALNAKEIQKAVAARPPREDMPETVSVTIPDELRQQIITLYDDCLGSAGGKDLATWMATRDALALEERSQPANVFQEMLRAA